MHERPKPEPQSVAIRLHRRGAHLECPDGSTRKPFSNQVNWSKQELRESGRLQMPISTYKAISKSANSLMCIGAADRDQLQRRKSPSAKLERPGKTKSVVRSNAAVELRKAAIAVRGFECSIERNGATGVPARSANEVSETTNSPSGPTKGA